MYQKYNQQLNLNYLRIFNAIYITKSTKKAAKLLGISQSAVSQTLTKMRDFTNDRLFYSIDSQLQPTYRADKIGEGLNDHLALLDDRLCDQSFFDPETFDGELTVAVSSLFLEALATELTTSVIFDSFPNAKLNITTWTDKTIEDIQNGTVHIGLNYYPIDTPKSVRSVPITTTFPVLITRKNHPWENDNRLKENLRHYPIGGMLLPGLSDNHAILEKHNKESFEFKYRSASMSVLACLAENSDMIAITEALSASMCNDNINVIRTDWLDELMPTQIQHAVYYLERNHHLPLYQHSCDIVKSLIAEKLSSINLKAFTSKQEE
ncbi:LysR family transcriptional regulator [Aliivibrio wodanis]|uniref:LysR family transcriptional regulator n=1 Tax=Aliivibrio wodanis TaxID=80852 RepID=UPI00406CFCE0